MQYFARVLATLSRSAPKSCNILHEFHPVYIRWNGDLARDYAVFFFCLRAVVFETPQSAAQTAPLAGEPWRTADNSKTFPQGNHGVSKKVG